MPTLARFQKKYERTTTYMRNSALLAVVVSQMLIIIAWEEHKFGTILNIIIILSMSAFGYYSFEKIVDRESSEIFNNVTRHKTKIISEKDLNLLPDIIKR